MASLFKSPCLATRRWRWRAKAPSASEIYGSLARHRSTSAPTLPLMTFRRHTDRLRLPRHQAHQCTLSARDAADISAAVTAAVSNGDTTLSEAAQVAKLRRRHDRVVSSRGGCPTLRLLTSPSQWNYCFCPVVMPVVVPVPVVAPVRRSSRRSCRPVRRSSRRSCRPARRS
jgi:hypothetical protein